MRGEKSRLGKWLIGDKKKKIRRGRRPGSIRLNLWPGKLVLLNLAERAYTRVAGCKSYVYLL